MYFAETFYAKLQAYNELVQVLGWKNVESKEDE